VLTYITTVTDKQMDEQTDKIAIAYIAVVHVYSASRGKNGLEFHQWSGLEH